MPMSWNALTRRSPETTSSTTSSATADPSNSGAGEYAAQDLGQHQGLVALHGVTRVLHDLKALELLCAPGQFVGVLIGDETRRAPAHQPDRHRQAGEVVPQAVEVGNLADAVIAPGPGAVIQSTRVVKDTAPQRFPIAVRRRRGGDLQNRVEAGEVAFTGHQSDGALLVGGQFGIAAQG